jgi:uncharacterized protein YbjT (DUF2867 family)
MDYTILFATHLMSDPAVNQRHNIMSDSPKFYSASNGMGVNYVSPNDIAAAAVRVLVNPKDHRRVSYTLTGPTHITDSQVTDFLSKDLNKTVDYLTWHTMVMGTFVPSTQVNHRSRTIQWSA